LLLAKKSEFHNKVNCQNSRDLTNKSDTVYTNIQINKPKWEKNVGQ